MIWLEIVGRFLISRAGLILLAAAGVYVFYEGVPIGPLRMIPGIEHVAWEGRVASERSKAREGYVLLAEKEAAEARAAALQRRLDAGLRALDGYAELLAGAQKKEQEDTAADEKLIADYEKRLAAKGGAPCGGLTADDLEFLR